MYKCTKKICTLFLLVILLDVFITKNMKYFLINIFVLIICVPLSAQGQDTQTKISSENSCIFVADNALIYGKELLIVAQNPSPKNTKKAAAIKKEVPTSKPAENKIAEQKPRSALFAFPIAPFSLYAQGGNKSVAVLQTRPGRQQQVAKTCQKSSYQATNQSNWPLYLPEQRQKLSIAATQCGVLTSFGSLPPPL